MFTLVWCLNISFETSNNNEDNGDDSSDDSSWENSVVESEEDAEVPVVEVADVEWCVDNVEAGEDDHDQWEDDGDQGQWWVDDDHNLGAEVWCWQPHCGLDQIHSSSPVTLSIGYLITEAIKLQ